MNLFNSISKKVMLGYIGIVVVTLVSSFAMYRESSIVFEQKETFVQETLPTLRAVEGASAALSNVQIASFGLYGLTTEANTFQRQINGLKAELDKTLQGISQAGLANLSQLNKEKGKIWRDVTRLQNIMGASSVDWDAARTALADIQKNMQGLQDLLTEVKTRASQNAEMASEGISNEITVMRTLIIASVLLILLITIASYSMAQRNIARPIKSLSQQLDRVVADHDLSKDVSVDCDDEVADTANSVNQLLVAFRQGNIKIQNSANVLVDSVAQLNHSAEVSEEQVQLFATHISELLEKIGALESSIEESANRSSAASDIALTGADQVKQGANRVSDTSGSIRDLAEDIERSAEMLLSLKNAGDQVSSVVKTIAEIAEQTNLLALNAAIEAARAGESGRGFAVVADEVRTLASRTHDSTHEINRILDTIVTSISSTVTSMDSNKSKATEAVELADNTVASLDAIQETVITLSKENSALASVGQDVKGNAGDMRHSIDAIEDASERVTESSKETKDAATSLSQTSASLSDVARQFKV